MTIASNSLDEILKNNQVLICAGSGGVGKTTVAAALGVRASELGLRVLVLTVDPAKRLATALGLDLSNDSEVRVPTRSEKQRLFAAVIDSRKTFDQFVLKHASDRATADRILRNHLYRQLSTTLAGSQEFTSLERLLEATESEKYDLVILDTPPTKHALDFLMAPQRIHSLFQDSITQWFVEATKSEKGWISGLVGRGTRTVLRSLEVLTGAQFIEELIDFFAAIHSVQAALRDRSIAVQKLLGSTKTRFLVVTSFDAAKLDEAIYLRSALKKMGFGLEAVVINRAFPLWMSAEPRTEVSDTARGPAYEKVWDFYQRFKQYHSVRYTLYEEFARKMGAALIFRIPEYDQDIHGLEDLEDLAARLAKGVDTR